MPTLAGDVFVSVPRLVAGALLTAALLQAFPNRVDAHATASGTREACEREAGGRGFTALEAGDPRDHRDGFSLTMRLRAYRGEVSTGTCFVDSRTGEVSLYGFGWGDSGRQPADFRFSCASIDRGRHECMLPVGGQARLVERYSAAECIEGKAWGQQDNIVWVDLGCRAKFEVARERDEVAAARRSQDGSQLVCRSDGAYRECAVGDGYTARLVEDLSGRCRDEADWGAREGLLWVNNGCEGRFERVRLNAPIEDQEAPASSPATQPSSEQ